MGSQLNTLHPLCHAGVCAQGYTGLIRNGSVAFSVPITHTCPHFLSLSSPSLSLSPPLLRFPPSTLYFFIFFYFAAVFSEMFWVTHLHQVTDNMSSTSVKLISILKHRCHDVSVSVETHSGIGVTFSHGHVTIHSIRLSENTLRDFSLFS